MSSDTERRPTGLRTQPMQIGRNPIGRRSVYDDFS